MYKRLLQSDVCATQKYKNVLTAWEMNAVRQVKVALKDKISESIYKYI
jgi:uncharacterized protein YdcH (DUF465 family)